LDDVLAQPLSNGRKLEGLEKDAPMFGVFMDLSDFAKPEAPKVALIVAVKDYAKFRDGVLDDAQKKALKKLENGIEEVSLPNGTESVYFYERKGWAIAAPQKETVEAFLKDFKGLDSRMNKEQAANLLKSDAAIYVRMEAVNKEYAEQIKAVRQQFNMGF